MKKKLLAFMLALCCVLLPVLTSCGEDDFESTSNVKPLTVTLYGIKGEGTTDEAVQAVQDAMNVYTEGNLSIRVLLRLYTEEEYYAKLDEGFVKAKEYKDSQKNNKKDNAKTEKAAETTSGEEDVDYELKFEGEKGTQVDIFMVRGNEMFQKYVSEGLAASIKLEEKSFLTNKYISARYLALTSKGTPTSGGLIEKATIYGVPCNYVSGDYTYLLVNKELAGKYYYSEKDVNTLDGLANFLDDAKTNHSDYITLYNAPEMNVETYRDTLLGAVMTDEANAYANMPFASLLDNSIYANYQKNMTLFKTEGYITEGDGYALPEGEKVAAAFIKGNAALAEEYEDEYFVIPYSKPVMNEIGTVFCVGKYTYSSARCLEVINALMTNREYRNIFQYGVENTHYRVDSYTGEYEIISKDYNMSYADTGNMFLLEPNNTMSKEMLALSENDWALAKQQYRDTVISPYIKFTDIENAEGRQLIIGEVEKASKAALDKLAAFDPASGITIDEYYKTVAEEFAANGWVSAFIDPTDGSSLVGQYNKWLESTR